MSTIKTPVDIIDSAVAELSAQIANRKERRDTLKSGKVRTMLVKLMTPLVYAVGKVGRISLHETAYVPSVYVYMHGLDSFKQYELVTTLEYLTAETEKLNGTISSQDWAAAVNRDFRFTTSKWEVSINAYVRGDSETCRKVVVGTEMKEVAKYQIVCD
jgi:hypothetical protein